MYTGLAQPEVKMNGLSVKNSTAFTSSSIFAVVSAMNARSAECMGGADFNRLEFPRRHAQGMTMSKGIFFIGAAALALAPLAADAQSTYRCQAKDGKNDYGSTIPQQCYGRLVEQLNAQGMVVRRIDPDEKALSEKEMEAKAKEKQDKEKRDAANREGQRRDRALLATYTSEKDIEDQRSRALADNQKAIKEQEARVADLRKKRASYDKEMEFYQDKKGGTKLPPKLQEEIRQTDFDLKVQEDALEARRKDVSTI